MLRPLEYVEQHNSAFLAFAALEYGFQVLKGAFGNGYLFARAEIGVAAFLAVGLGAKRLHQCTGYAYGGITKGEEAQYTAGRANGPPVAHRLVEANKQIVGEQGLGHGSKLALAPAFNIQHWVKHLITLVSEVLGGAK